MAYEKLEEIVPGFDREIMNFCNDIAARRNAELHSGESPFENMRVDDLEERYWGVCHTILDHVGSSKERWMEADHISTSPKIFEETAIGRGLTVVARVDEARINFKSKKELVKNNFLMTVALVCSLYQGCSRKNMMRFGIALVPLARARALRREIGRRIQKLKKLDIQCEVLTSLSEEASLQSNSSAPSVVSNSLAAKRCTMLPRAAIITKNTKEG